MKQFQNLKRKKINSENISDFAKAEAIAYTALASEYYINRLKKLATPDRAIALFDENKIIGTANSFGESISLPSNKKAKVAAVSYVSVMPTHRRQGILSEMMKIQLNEIHSVHKEPLAVLWPSESAIYGRFGYAPTHEKHYSISKNNAKFLPQISSNNLKINFLNKKEAIECYVQVNNKLMESRPGVMELTNDWAERRIEDLISNHLSNGPSYFIGIFDNKTPVGLVTYSIENNNDYGNMPASLHIWDILYLNIESAIKLWNFCLNIDLVEEIHAKGVPEDDVLEALLISPGDLNARLTTGLWIRIVDVINSLEARTYEHNGEIILKVEDSIIKDNNNTYLLNTNDKSTPKCEITSKNPDVEITIQGLSEIYLGTFDLNNLIASGNINIKNKKVIKTIKEIFKSEPKPFCPMHF